MLQRLRYSIGLIPIFIEGNVQSCGEFIPYVASAPNPAARTDCWRSRPAASALGGLETMTHTVENLVLDLIAWVGRKERTYHETMDAWRTSCPRLPVWEDATELGFVETAAANGSLLVRATSAGFDLLREKRPHEYEELRQQGGALPNSYEATGCQGVDGP